MDNTNEREFSTEDMAKLYTALISFQGECPVIKKTAKNPFFQSTYAPFEEIMHTVRPILCKHGLAVIFPLGKIGDIQVLKTRLVHESGVYIEAFEEIRPDKDTPQGRVAATTYAMRNGLRSILGLPTDDDDDGNVASGSQEPKQQKNRENFNDTFDNGGEPAPKQYGGSAILSTPAKGCFACFSTLQIEGEEVDDILYAAYGKEAPRDKWSKKDITIAQWEKLHKSFYPKTQGIEAVAKEFACTVEELVTYLKQTPGSWSDKDKALLNEDSKGEIFASFTQWRQEQAEIAKLDAISEDVGK